ncbi:MAG: hypothetical protein HPY66_3235 [Firmicutes bacterium]|nr:hypothetical protein [Bacillota bacterium]
MNINPQDKICYIFEKKQERGHTAYQLPVISDQMTDIRARL